MTVLDRIRWASRPQGELLVECVGAARVHGRGPGAVAAAHGVHCAVHRGDRIALSGPSGSGKSTLLHLLSGLDTPTSGIVAWPTWRGSPAGRPGLVGVVFQGQSLLPDLDVAENVALPLLIAGVPTDAAALAAGAALATLGIGELAAKLPDEISGGQAQRVAVARVLAARPALILADEPTGRLDRAAAHRVVDVLIDTADELNAGLVIGTHDETVAARMRTSWRMADGRVHTGASASGAGLRGPS
ncbi:ABC transporter ATP-binding protein [Pseudonocardia hydrocarbonoxydans]|uniref:ABC transporter ATP-binding protein n=1 Tax=Pseudonocardia hydrocarbonoxydans TaxID=76726 RepID=A0A4Y3WK65_9PSEU|nr:ABC transporter ATP-binding protein [Pseudonocardia hydrocarbonoxydans]GEC18631.1 ABC transporter ATP-binding protein [Pseudonocardia hydrocarbonoxydans]